MTAIAIPIVGRAITIEREIEEKKRKKIRAITLQGAIKANLGVFIHFFISLFFFLFLFSTPLLLIFDSFYILCSFKVKE